MRCWVVLFAQVATHQNIEMFRRPLCPVSAELSEWAEKWNRTFRYSPWFQHHFHISYQWFMPKIESICFNDACRTTILWCKNYERPLLCLFLPSLSLWNRSSALCIRDRPQKSDSSAKNLFESHSEEKNRRPNFFSFQNTSNYAISDAIWILLLKTLFIIIF